MAAAQRTKKAGAKVGGAQPNRVLYIAVAVAVLFIALLIGAAHSLKRAKRRARAARAAAAAAGVPYAGDEEPSWIVSERTIAIAAAVVIGAGAIVSVSVVYGSTWMAALAARRARLKAESEARRLAAQKREDKERSRMAATAGREALRKHEAKESAERAAFERSLLQSKAADEAARAEAAATERARRREEDLEAWREAEAIDERTRAAAAAAAEARTAGAAAARMGGATWEHSWADEEGADLGADLGAEVAEAPSESEGSEVEEPRMDLELNPRPRGTQLVLESLALADDATARAARLEALLGCVRCGETATVSLSGLIASEAEKRVWCAKCSCLLSAALRPTMLHLTSPLLGHVETHGCTLADVPRLDLLLACGKCDGELIIDRVERGKRVRESCRYCHAQLPCYYANLQLIRLAGAAGGAVGGARGGDEDDELEELLRKARKKNSDQLSKLGICVGKPLPNKGTCKHFKYSYRWLRFPCCGRAYPCATCHVRRCRCRLLSVPLS